MAARAGPRVARVHHLLARPLADQPEALAVVEDGRGWNYSQLAQESARVAEWLTARGVSAGDRVMTVLPASAYLVALLYACSSRGAILVPVAPSTTGFHLSAFIADVRPSVVVVALPETMRSIRADGLVVDLDALIASLPGAGAHKGRGRSEVPDGQPVAFLLYTSGTSSLPKAVVCPHDQVLFATQAIGGRLGYRPGDVVYSKIPMSFDYGLYQALLCAQAMCTLALAESTPALRMMSEMREVGATVVPLVPPLATLLSSLAPRASARPPVRLLTNTGAPLPAATAAGLRSTFPAAQVSVMYGLTECKRATIMPPDGDLARPDSAGIPLPGTAVRILADGELTREPGVSGEIVIEGPHVMAGYWQDDALTAKKFFAAAGGRRLLLTGDVGYLDADGYLFLAGRLDDTFSRNGVRMSCREIEFAALDIPGVREVAALPPDGRLDLAIVVAGELRPASVRRSLADRLPAEKCPAYLEVLPALPVTPHGKVDRQSLRRRLEGIARGADR